MKTLTNLPIAVIIPLLLIGCLAVDGPAIDNFAKNSWAEDNRQRVSVVIPTVERAAAMGKFGSNSFRQ